MRQRTRYGHYNEISVGNGEYALGQADRRTIFSCMNENCAALVGLCDCSNGLSTKKP